MILPSTVNVDCSDEHDNPNTPSCNLQLAADPLARLASDAWHHHYHYQASAQYLWLGETLRAFGQIEEATTAYQKAVFQDHSNQEAIHALEGIFMPMQSAPHYDTHPEYDAVFCVNIGRPATHASVLHDEAVDALHRQDYTRAITVLNAAIATDPAHSNSHFTRGKCFFLLDRNAGEREYLEKARIDFTEAIRLSHTNHNTYHQSASHDHMLRGNALMAKDNIDLAIADYSKALDLFPGNTEARRVRAKAYRAKGNIPLALADEELL